MNSWPATCTAWLDEKGQRSALLLTPADQVSEPATWAVFGLAAAAFAWRERRAA